MSLFRCCFGKSKKKDPDVVKTSTIKKNLTLCGEIDWNVLNFDPRDKIWNTQMSRDFIFFFPEADKFFKFALAMNPTHYCGRRPFSYASLCFINRNSEDLEISTIFRRSEMGRHVIKAQSEEKMFYSANLTEEFIQGNLQIHIDFSLSYAIFENVDPKLHETQKRLLTDAAFVDFTIECGNEEFPCHKAILANRSDFFARLFFSQEWIESKKDVFQIKGHDPAVVKQMLEFIYANQIPDGTGGSLQLLLIAEEFCLKDLVKFCKSKIEKTSSCDNTLGKPLVLEKNLKLGDKMVWSIENFNPNYEDWVERTSPDFSFYFPEVNKTFKFGLKLIPGHFCSFHLRPFVCLHLINKNSEDLKMFAFLNASSWKLRSDNILYGYGAPETFLIKAQSSCSIFETATENFSEDLIKEKLRVYFSIPDSIFINLDPKFHQDQRRLLESAAFADFAIECGTEKFPCHKAILANRSDFFARLFSSQEWIEGKKKVFQIKGHDPAVVKQMLEFIYANQIPDGTQCSLDLLVIADQFKLKHLVKFCEAKIAKTLSCDNALKILSVAADVPDASQLNEYAVQFVAKNISSFMVTEDWKDVVEPKPDLLQAIKKIAFKP